MAQLQLEFAGMEQLFWLASVSLFIGTFQLEILDSNLNNSIVINSGDPLILKILYSLNDTDLLVKSNWNLIVEKPSFSGNYQTRSSITSSAKRRINVRKLSKGTFEESLTLKSINALGQGIYEVTLQSGNSTATHQFPPVYVNLKAEVSTVDLQNDRINPRFLRNGVEYSVICYSKGYPLPDLWWEFKNCASGEEFACCDQWQMLNVDEKFKSVVEIQGTNTKLSLVTFEADSYRIFRCNARNDLHSFDSKLFSYVGTTIEESEKNSGFSIVPSSVETAFIGDDFQLSCVAQKFDYTSLYWEFESEMLGGIYPSMPNNKTIVNQQLWLSYDTSNPTINVLTLNFGPLSNNNSGNYSCNAAYHKVVLKRLFSLSVTLAPEFNYTSLAKDNNVTLDLTEQLLFVDQNTPKAAKVMGIFALVGMIVVGIFVIYCNKGNIRSMSTCLKLSK